MAEGQDPANSLTMSSWYSSTILRDHSNQSPTPLSSFTDIEGWYHKAASCTLTCGNRSAQGIVALVSCQKIANLLHTSGRVLVLLTNHHVISSKEGAIKWEISMGLQSTKLRLREESVVSCFSCCGPNGVLCDETHENNSCPFRNDFTLLVLSEKFSNIILKKELLFPSIDSMSSDAIKEAFINDRFAVFNRDKKTGVIRENDLKMRARGPPTDECSIESRIATFKARCVLEYNYDSDVCSGTSGAGICCRNNNERTLLGIHVCHGEGKKELYGTSVYSILCSIEGGDTVISCISQLKDVLNHNKRFPGSRSTKTTKRWYQHVQNYLKSQNRGSGAQESHVDEKRDKLIFQLLNYLLRSQNPKFIFFDAENPLTRCSLTLLSEVLNVLMVYTGTKVSDIVKEFDQGENIFQVRLKEASKQVIELMRITHDEAILTTCFECYSKIIKFPFDYEDHPHQNASNLSILNSVRSRSKTDSEIHKYFGDICILYRAFMRDKSNRQSIKDSKLIDEIQLDLKASNEQCGKTEEDLVKFKLANHELTKIEAEYKELLRTYTDLKAENEDLKADNKDLKAENKDLNVENEVFSRKACNGGVRKNSSLCSPTSDGHNSSQCSPTSDGHNYPIQRAKSGSLDSTHRSSESNLIWDQDMQEVIKDVKFRDRIAKHFKKTPSSKSAKTWEHLIAILELEMDVEDLEGVDVGNILNNIITEWSKTTRVSVRMFCKVCDEMKITRIKEEFFTIQSNITDKSLPQLGRSVSNSNSVDV